MNWFVLTLAAAAACVGGWAAAADAPYQPKSAATGGVGYGQEQIDDTHWLVKFAGDRNMELQTVETYLLYRAAELTVKKGGDWFETSDGKTSVKKDVPDQGRSADAARPGGGASWRPHWRYYQLGRVEKFDPGRPDFTRLPPRGPSAQKTERFVAEVQISIGKGPLPSDQRAFDARRLMDQLGPDIRKPAERPAGSTGP